MLLQWNVKDPGQFTESAGGRLHLNTRTPVTQRSRIGLTVLSMQAECGDLLGKRAHTQLVGERWLQSSQPAEPLWADPGRKSGIGLRELMSIKNKRNKTKKGAGRRSSHQKSSPKPSYARKEPTPVPLIQSTYPRVGLGVFEGQVSGQRGLSTIWTASLAGTIVDDVDTKLLKLFLSQTAEVPALLHCVWNKTDKASSCVLNGLKHAR